MGTNPDLGQQYILNLQNLRLFRATEHNISEVYGYEPVFNAGEYYFLPGTNRCGVNHGCSFVLTHNARVNSWSPNKIVLTRIGTGPILLNMNPGKVWLVNGKPIFKHYKIVEMRKDFVINDPARRIEVSFQPTL